MWILNFLPSWIYQAFVLFGLVGIIVSIFTGFFSRFLPTLLLIKLPLQIISIGFLVFGVYLWGGIANQEMWEARVKEMQDKVAIAEQKSKEVNTKIQYKYIDKIKVVQEVQIVVQEKIKEVAVRIDSECKVTNEAVDILNMAAKNSKAGAGK